MVPENHHESVSNDDGFNRLKSPNPNPGDQDCENMWNPTRASLTTFLQMKILSQYFAPKTSHKTISKMKNMRERGFLQIWITPPK